MKSKLMLLFVGVGLLLASCATLQEDIYVTADGKEFLNQSVSEYEKRFVEIDAEYTGKKFAYVSEIDALISDIDKQLSDAHIELAVAARLNALKGLLYIIESKPKKAEECYAVAKSQQSGDVYVNLLNIRLQKDNDASLALCDEILSYDSGNPIVLLEKGMWLFKKGRYSDSVATIDNSFLIFDKERKTYYRELYGGFRNSVWELSKSGIESFGADVDIVDFEEVLTKEKMVSIALSNTTLLDGFTGGEKFSSNSLMKKLEAAGYFSIGSDQSNKEKSSTAIMSSKEITRILCARFLWNLYTRAIGNTKLLTAYSTRYAKLKNPKSPIADVPLESPDFDAVLGVVEKEIMNLPDGKNFLGDESVTVFEYARFLKNCADKCK